MGEDVSGALVAVRASHAGMGRPVQPVCGGLRAHELRLYTSHASAWPLSTQKTTSVGMDVEKPLHVLRVGM